MKIKIIDLLTKIANEEEVPMLIKWNDDEWYYTNNISKTYSNDKEDLFSVIDGTNLNDEVEILEEDKKIPELQKDILHIDDLIAPVDENMYKIWTQTIKNHNKINEIIDYLKSKGE